MINLKWPNKGNNGYAPWYTILWRLLWFPSVALGYVFLYIGLAISWGPEEAKRTIRNI